MWIELIASLVTVVATIVIYYYITNVPPGAKLIIQEIPEFSEAVDNNTARLMFFWASWCPYCKQAWQPWKSLQQVIKNDNLTYGGKSVSFEDINAETNKGKAALYKINAYPTFKVVTDKKVYEMLGKPTVPNLREFLKKALGDEKASH